MNRNKHKKYFRNYKHILFYFFILISQAFLVFLESGCSIFLCENNIKEEYGWIKDKVNITGNGLFMPQPELYDRYDLSLDGSSVSSYKLLSVEETGYHELNIEKKNNGVFHSEIYRFVILDPVRGRAEWGLIPWTPPPFSSDSATLSPLSSLSVIYPHSYPESLILPFIIIIKESGNLTFFNKYCNMPSPLPDVKVKRGFGSIVTPEYPDGTTLSFMVDSLTVNSGFSVETGVSWTEKGGIISVNEIWSGNSRIHIIEDIVLEEGNTLTIENNSIVIIDKNINIYVSGNLIINGTSDGVIVLTSSNTDQLWGGIIITGNTAMATVYNAIFTSSGGNSGMGFGHSNKQPLFMVRNNATLTCEGVYIIDNGGQAFGGSNAQCSIKDSLIQRCETGGQFNDCQLSITGSTFTDFPTENSQYIDNDNDCIYIAGGSTVAVISTSRFMYAKDDGIDSGSSSGGDITITDCIIDSCFHEGLALSSGNPSYKTHTITNTFVTQCQQGIELGYSSVHHNVFIEHCLLYNNNIGLRYGDNYKWGHTGTMYVKDTIIVGNIKDIWNMIPETWELRHEGISLFNTRFHMSQLCYGEQEIISYSFSDTMRVLPMTPGYHEGTDGENIGLME